MKILVTGANGYIGSKVVKRLCDLKHIVIANDFNNTHIDSRAKFVNVNIFDNRENWYKFFENPDICLHLAWKDGFIHNSDAHMEYLSNHFKFIKNLVQNGLRHFATMGTMHEVGYWEGKIDEHTPCNPQSQYGIAKNALRQSLELYFKDKKCIFQWLRAFYIFGDDTFGNSIFCKLRRGAENGDKFFPFTSGKNKYDFLHIDDITEQIVDTITQKKINGVINCCSGKAVSLAEKIEWYISSNNLPIKLDYGKYPDRSYDSPCIYGDDTKIKKIMSLKNKKILVTGAKGQLGYDCMRELASRGYKNIKGIDIDDLDITNENNVIEFISKYHPDVIMHNAAYTSVDKAELNSNTCYQVNALGAKYIAEAAKLVNAKMVYISTDYVFEGTGVQPYETTDSKKGISIYGYTKGKGEDFVTSILDKYFIVRISWVFGINGNNFVKTMLKLADAGKTEINVVKDQIGSVTYTADLAKLLCDMIETEKYGIYHATNEGYLSWAEFAEEIFKLAHKNVKVNYVTTDEYLKLVPQQAKRPLNSRMSKESLDKAGFNRLPDWHSALERYLNELTNK